MSLYEGTPAKVSAAAAVPTHCTSALHGHAWVAELLWGHDGLKALGLLMVLLPLHVHGCGGGTLPLYSEHLCSANALSVPLLAFGMGDVCDCKLHYT